MTKGLEHIPTSIPFPRPIIEAELDDLMRYLVAQVREERSSVLEVSLRLEKNRHYGERGKEYHSLDEVRIRPGDLKCGGQ